jgi:hypothetical protein
MNDGKKYGFTTTILHSDRQKPIEHGSLHKPIHTSVAYGYRDARELADVFQGKKPGYRYGRQGNPTVTALEEKITRMEEGVSTLCFATVWQRLVHWYKPCCVQVIMLFRLPFCLVIPIACGKPSIYRACLLALWMQPMSPM